MVSRLAFNLSLSSAISKLVFFLAASSFSLVFTSRSATVVAKKKKKHKLSLKFQPFFIYVAVIWKSHVLKKHKTVTFSLTDSTTAVKMISGGKKRNYRRRKVCLMTSFSPSVLWLKQCNSQHHLPEWKIKTMTKEKTKPRELKTRWKENLNW